LKSQEDFDKFVEDNKVAVIYFGESEEEEAFKAFKTVAMGYEKLGFAHVFDSGITEHANASKGKIVLFKKFDERRNEFDERITTAELKKWVDTHSFATVMEFDDRAIEKVF